MVHMTQAIIFQQSNQSQGETLDRPCHGPSFKGLSPPTRGLWVATGYYPVLSKEAWQHVCVHGPKSMEEAINNVRWFEHVHHDVYGNMAMTESRTAFQDP